MSRPPHSRRGRGGRGEERKSILPWSQGPRSSQSRLGHQSQSHRNSGGSGSPEAAAPWAVGRVTLAGPLSHRVEMTPAGPHCGHWEAPWEGGLRHEWPEGQPARLGCPLFWGCRSVIQGLWHLRTPASDHCACGRSVCLGPGQLAFLPGCAWSVSASLCCPTFPSGWKAFCLFVFLAGRRRETSRGCVAVPAWEGP